MTAYRRPPTSPATTGVRLTESALADLLHHAYAAGAAAEGGDTTGADEHAHHVNTALDGLGIKWMRL